ncbi:MAG: hypothetical protein OXB96_01780 [Candidatus Kaiserbacteria bacterium]|nr:hypothetical protein [Candidatus Kaiserbacteria bacterium]
MLTYALSAKEIANNLFDHIVNPLMAGMLFIAILFFIIIAVKLIAGAESTERKDLFTKLGWSIAGIFIITSVWTIIAFVSRVAESDIKTSLYHSAEIAPQLT